MLQHWSEYAADSDRRLHPLYDVLQVAERLYRGRKNAALALKMSEADLDDLGRISNHPAVLNGRHPGRTLGPHRVATESEANTCERLREPLSRIKLQSRFSSAPVYTLIFWVRFQSQYG